MRKESMPQILLTDLCDQLTLLLNKHFTACPYEMVYKHQIKTTQLWRKQKEVLKTVVTNASIFPAQTSH